MGLMMEHRLYVFAPLGPSPNASSSSPLPTRRHLPASWRYRALVLSLTQCLTYGFDALTISVTELGRMGADAAWGTSPGGVAPLALDTWALAWTEESCLFWRSKFLGKCAKHLIFGRLSPSRNDSRVTR